MVKATLHVEVSWLTLFDIFLFGHFNLLFYYFFSLTNKTIEINQNNFFDPIIELLSHLNESFHSRHGSTLSLTLSAVEVSHVAFFANLILLNVPIKHYSSVTRGKKVTLNEKTWIWIMRIATSHLSWLFVLKFIKYLVLMLVVCRIFIDCFCRKKEF